MHVTHDVDIDGEVSGGHVFARVRAMVDHYPEERRTYDCPGSPEFWSLSAVRPIEVTLLTEDEQGDQHERLVDDLDEAARLLAELDEDIIALAVASASKAGHPQSKWN